MRFRSKTATLKTDPVAAAVAAAQASTYSPINSLRAGNAYVAIGDSVDYGIQGNNWPVLASQLSLGQLHFLANMGVAGNRSDQMLARFDTDVTPYAPSVVSIGAGTNDIAQSVAFVTYKANIRALVAKCYAIGAAPVIRSIPPSNTAGLHGTITAWNGWLRRYCQVNRIPYLDFYNLLVDPANGNYLAAYFNDGTHPNEAGYMAMGALAANVLASRLPGTLDLLPADNADPSNLISGGLFLTNGSGRGTGWGTYGSNETFSIDTTDTSIKGNWQDVTVTTAGPSGTYPTVSGTVPAVGNRVALTGLYRLSNLSAGAALTIYLQAQDNAFADKGTLNVVQAVKSAVTKGLFYGEMIMPPGATRIAMLAFNSGAACKFGLAQVGMYDLTALGIASI